MVHYHDNLYGLYFVLWPLTNSNHSIVHVHRQVRVLLELDLQLKTQTHKSLLLLLFHLSQYLGHLLQSMQFHYNFQIVLIVVQHLLPIHHK